MNQFINYVKPRYSSYFIIFGIFNIFKTRLALAAILKVIFVLRNYYLNFIIYN